MSHQRRSSLFLAALVGLASAGLLVGGCDFIYDFNYDPIGGAGGAGSGSTSSGAGGTSSGPTTSSSSGAGGTCAPTAPECGIELVTKSIANDSLTKPFGDIAVTDQTLYLLAAERIFRLPSGSLGVDLPVGVKLFGATFLAGSIENQIVVGTPEAVWSVPPDGVPVQVPNVPSTTGMTGLAVSSGFTYWASVVGDKIFKSDGTNAPTSIGALGGAQNVILDMMAASAADPTVYWLYRNVAGGSGGIRAYGDAADPDFETLGSEEPVALAVDGDSATGSVYWLTYNGVAHGRTKAAGPIFDSKPAMMASTYAKFKTGRIVVGGSYVYWLGATGDTCLSNKVCACGEECGAIMAAPKGTLQPPVVFAKGTWASLRGLAVDSQYVYWTAAADTDDVLLRKKMLP